MASMFMGATVFNADISTWDVSSVTNMSGMFVDATSFDGDISKWDVSGVTSMSGMFGQAESFVILDDLVQTPSLESVTVEFLKRCIQDAGGRRHDTTSNGPNICRDVGLGGSRTGGLCQQRAQESVQQGQDGWTGLCLER